MHAITFTPNELNHPHITSVWRLDMRHVYTKHFAPRYHMTCISVYHLSLCLLFWLIKIILNLILKKPLSEKRASSAHSVNKALWIFCRHLSENLVANFTTAKCFYTCDLNFSPVPVGWYIATSIQEDRTVYYNL